MRVRPAGGGVSGGGRGVHGHRRGIPVADLCRTRCPRRGAGRALRGAGVGRGMVVGIRLHRSPEVVIAILAVLKAGAAYLPLDPVYLPERVGFMLTDTAATVVLTQSDLADDLTGLPVHCVCLDHPLPTAPDTDPEPGPRRNRSGVCHATSGSTGQPKGVQVTPPQRAAPVRRHRSLVRVRTHRRVDAVSLYAFDVSVWEMWGALLHGGRLVIVDHDTSRDPAALRACCNASRSACLCQTPARSPACPTPTAPAPGRLRAALHHLRRRSPAAAQPGTLDRPLRRHRAPTDQHVRHHRNHRARHLPAHHRHRRGRPHRQP